MQKVYSIKMYQVSRNARTNPDHSCVEYRCILDRLDRLYGGQMGLYNVCNKELFHTWMLWEMIGIVAVEWEDKARLDQASEQKSSWGALT